MGRRKKAQKKVKKKVKVEVATSFKCLFCNTDKSVSCKMSFTSMVGSLHCRICDVSYETQIHQLSDPIDVFSEWLDEAEEMQRKEVERVEKGQTEGYMGDGADYDPKKDDMGEDDNNDIVGSDVSKKTSIRAFRLE
jgi:transcription elongation factor Elf1